MKPLYIITAFIVVYDGFASANDQKAIGRGRGHVLGSSKDPFTADFSSYANHILEAWRVPGMSIAVVDGEDVFAKGFGFAIFPDTLVEPDTLFYIGSLSKAFTAATLSQLMDIKTLPQLSGGWHTPISSIIHDDFVLQDEWATQHLNLDDAASHRSGFFGHDSSWHHKRDGKLMSVKDVVQNLRHLPMSLQPRLSYHYSNFMYVALSHVVEVLTGRLLGDIMKEMIWEPLGMKSTYMNLEDAANSSHTFAASYAWQQSKGKYLKMPFLHMGEVSGAGAIISNVIDYAQWIMCLLHETEPFSKRVHSDIKTPRFITSYDQNTVTHYTIGWNRGTFHNQTTFRHQGSTYTQGSNAFWLPDVKFGVITLANGAGTSNDAGSVLVQRLVEDKLGILGRDRVDLDKELKEKAKEARRQFERASKILYPKRPANSIPPSVDTFQLTGTYHHPGYGTIDLCPTSDEVNGTSAVALEADRKDITWLQKWRLQHVSGDYWILYISPFHDPEALPDFCAAQFHIEVSGNVSSLEVDFSDQAEGVRQSRITFQKVAS